MGLPWAPCLHSSRLSPLLPPSRGQDLRQRLHVRALPQAGGELLGPGSCELVVLDAGGRNPSWDLTKATCPLPPAGPPPMAVGKPPACCLLGLALLPRLAYSLHHPQGHHVWKHLGQAPGSHVTDAIIIQAVRNTGWGRTRECWGSGSRGTHAQLGLVPHLTEG